MRRIQLTTLRQVDAKCDLYKQLMKDIARIVWPFIVDPTHMNGSANHSYFTHNMGMNSNAISEIKPD